MQNRYFNDLDTDIKVASWDGQVDEVIKREEVKEEKRYSANRKRKVRSDAKKRVKIPLSADQKENLKWITHENSDLAFTNFSTKIVLEGLEEPFVLNSTFPDDYNGSDSFVSIKLDQHDHNRLNAIAIRMDCSLRQAAYTILMYMLNRYPAPRKRVPERTIEIKVGSKRYGLEGY
ncbi:hypothetical protein [Metabacillus fastidiosus]|uniref:hypothetical protein n=1 Tax=Metabacillus fastidiosus TaxID=1458 RepID=UPI003D279CE2